MRSRTPRLVVAVALSFASAPAPAQVVLQEVVFSGTGTSGGTTTCGGFCKPTPGAGGGTLGGINDFVGSSIAVGAAITVAGAPNFQGRGGVVLSEQDTPNVILSITTGAVGDKFGSGVAASPDGRFVFVGAPDAGGSGRVYVFVRPIGGWQVSTTPFQVLSPPAPAGVAVDGFGSSIAVDASGTLVVGAPETDQGTSVDVGAAFVVERSGGSYSLSSTLLPPQGSAVGDKFGSAVAIGGGMVAIGVPGTEVGKTADAGQVFIYAESAGMVGQPTAVQAPTPGVGDKFGAAVALSDPPAGQMPLLVVGAPAADTPAGTDSGAAVVFLPGPLTATPVATLLPASGTNQLAGTAVATNGAQIAIGAPQAALPSGETRGLTYLYDAAPLVAVQQQKSSRKGAAPVQPSFTVTKGFGGSTDAFGTAVALSRTRLAIGAPRDSTGASQQGSASTYTFELVLRDGFE